MSNLYWLTEEQMARLKPCSQEPRGEKRGRGRLIGRTKGGMNTKLHAVIDENGRPIRFFMTAEPLTGAAALRGACQRRTGCWQTEVMTPIGSEKA